MKRLIIVSERTRGHYQSGLGKLKRFDVVHFYRHTFADMTVDESDPNFIRYGSVFELYRFLKAAKPDVIQPLEPYYGYSRFGLPFRVLPIIIATYWFCRVHRTAYFIHFLENIVPNVKYRWPFALVMKKIAKTMVASAKFVFYVNDAAKKNIVSLGGGRKAIFGLWGIWGVDTAEFKKISQRAKFDLLFVGKINDQKGVLDLVEALSHVKEKIPSISVNIVGSGELMSELRNKVRKLSLENNVEISGEVPDNEIVKYYQNASILVMPSKTLRHSAEQVGMVAVEAMACGLPVIAYDSGSLREFVLDGQTGLLVNERQVEALSEKIIKLVLDHKLRNKLSQGAQALVKEKFDQNKNVPQLESIVYQKIFS